MPENLALGVYLIPDPLETNEIVKAKTQYWWSGGVSVDEFMLLADKYFPKRGKDNSPSYRPHQRETIQKILSAFLVGGKKYVAVDGPVGCGKSAINYTVGMVLSDAVYITPLKMLQDQVMDEKWPDVKMLKGRTSYTCNYAELGGITTYCGDDNPEIATCKTKPGKDKLDAEKLVESINVVHRRLANNDVMLNRRTAFSDSKDYNVQRFAGEAFLDSSHDESLGKRTLTFEHCISCEVASIECPAKSSRMVVKLSKIKVLNPDVFYYLTLGANSMFNENALLIFDECQKIEDIVSRIFKSKFSIGVLKSMYGLDFEFVKMTNTIEGLLEQVSLYIKNDVGPATECSKLLKSLGDIMSVRNYATLMRARLVSDTQLLLKSSVEKYLYQKRTEIGPDWEFSILNVLSYAFSGKQVPEEYAVFGEFVLDVRTRFEESCNELGYEAKYDIEKYIIPAVKNFIRKNKVGIDVHSMTPKIKQIDMSLYMEDEMVISQDRITSTVFSYLRDLVGDFLRSISQLKDVSVDGKQTFLLSVGTSQLTAIYPDSSLQIMLNKMGFNLSDLNEGYLELVPISIGPLMNKFFYAKAEKVLLTSGTWVGIDNLVRLYGMPRNDVEFIKIPSGFDVSRRPVYILDNKSYTDFSQKSCSEYIYKSRAGTIKFTNELQMTISSVKKYVELHHKVNTNIIIHAHTFDIVKRIAQSCSIVDSNWIFHLPSNSREIKNEFNGNISYAREKDEAIQAIKSNPNSGMVLVSPSITEGVDFKGDIARVQIVLKRPVPYMGDVYISAHCNGNQALGIPRDSQFFNRLVYTTLIQEYGRVMRAPDDWGYTIMLDQSIAYSVRAILKKLGSKEVEDLNIGYLTDGIKHQTVNGSILFQWPFRQ